MLNRVVLQGRLTRDPELKTTRNNIEVCSFTVAWSEKYKDHERKLFCNCTAWRQTGAFVSRYFVKGSPILVEGSLETRKYTDKDGRERSVMELICDKVHFCGDKPGGDATGGHKKTSDAAASDFEELPPFTDDDDGLPF